MDLAQVMPSVETAAFFRKSVELYQDVVSSLSEQLNETDLDTVECDNISSEQ